MNNYKKMVKTIMKDRHFLLVFIIGYFLSIDAALRNPYAGLTSGLASLTGITIIVMPPPSNNEE